MISQKIIWSVILTISTGLSAYSQNLIVNPGFEQITGKPVNPLDYNAQSIELGNFNLYTNFKGIKGWSSATMGTPDVFQLLDTSLAHSGSCIAFAAIISNHYEYPQAVFTQPLVTDSQYVLSFWIRPTADARVFPKEICALFRQTRLLRGGDDEIGLEPDLVWGEAAMPHQHWQWVELRDTFTAKGGEWYLIIGNFKSIRETTTLPLEGGKSKYTGMHIDDVSLVPLYPITLTQPVKLEVGTSYRINHIYFEHDKAILLPASYPELDSLAIVFSQYPELLLQIEGHTDNTGSASYNLDLSQRRAEAVVAYLISKGIDSKRLKAKGFGSAQPLNENKTEEERAANRRVEFKVMEE